MRIGIFDSGVGGLSVMQDLLYSKKFSEIIYFGDTANAPYGTRDKNNIIELSCLATNFFKDKNIDALIVACNTISALALPQMRAISKFDVVGVIEPSIATITDKIKNKDSKICIMATKATIDSKIYTKMLSDYGYNNFIEVSASNLIPLIENGHLSGKDIEECVETYMPKERYDVLILACTHFPLVKDIFMKYTNNITIIHAGDATLGYLNNIYKLTDLYENTITSISASGNIKHLENMYLAIKSQARF